MQTSFFNPWSKKMLAGKVGPANHWLQFADFAKVYEDRSLE
jgi:hypothetical protein